MPNFSDNDINQIEAHGLSVGEVQHQLSDFVNGFPYTDIIRPAIAGDGIRHLYTDADSDRFVDLYISGRDKYKIVKFVPASGAATRMFRDLFEYVQNGEHNTVSDTVINNLTRFAFWPNIAQMDNKIEYLCREYGNRPKALIEFHSYPDGPRTAAEEHLAEGAQYAASNNTVNIHFTVSPEHIDAFRQLFNRILDKYEHKFGVKYNISMSVQKPQTDTIAVNMDNSPFRDEDGNLVFRPAGHGALIENLNDIDADIIFIKNIDNVCMDSNRNDTIRNKCLIGGILIHYQQKIFKYIHAIDNGSYDADEIRDFIINDLCVIPNKHSSDEYRRILNRPLRVCGIVKNTGEPGGGPFWTRAPNGDVALQIVEPAQIEPKNREILKKSEFFSPTDIAVAPRDAFGKKFDLTHYIDPSAGFISEKSKNGRPLRAMERPGLWNGAMAYWNTVFVAVPITTFTPVKVVSDLLNGAHTQI